RTTRPSPPTWRTGLSRSTDGKTNVLTSWAVSTPARTWTKSFPGPMNGAWTCCASWPTPYGRGSEVTTKPTVAAEAVIELAERVGLSTVTTRYVDDDAVRNPVLITGAPYRAPRTKPLHTGRPLRGGVRPLAGPSAT